MGTRPRRGARNFNRMQITVVGTGYVGLVTGGGLAHLGHHVTCMDVDEAKIRLLCGGRLPIYEPGLETLIAEEVRAGRLRFTSDYAEAVPGSEAIFICVGTPSRPGGEADTSYVEAAARSLGDHLGTEYCVIINKSTVPIGSGDWVGMLIRQGTGRRAACDAETGGNGGNGGNGGWTAAETLPEFDVVSNPEFLREGSAIADALQPDRIVVGVESERALERMRELYAPLLQRNAAAGRDVPFVVMDRASAEMVKYAANAFLATKISFINEIANICERVGADVLEVARGIGLDSRIGSAFLNAGIGWGGSCFPKDLASLAHTAQEYDYETRLLNAVQQVNEAQRAVVIRKLQERLKLLKGKTIALWGLAFKPGTDDLRDAPSRFIAERLHEMGAAVRAYDPQAMEGFSRLGLNVEFAGDPCEAAREADAVVLVTEWPEFRQVNWSELHALMHRPLIIDGRNALDQTTLLCHGFEYCGIGR